MGIPHYVENISQLLKVVHIDPRGPSSPRTNFRFSWFWINVHKLWLRILEKTRWATQWSVVVFNRHTSWRKNIPGTDAQYRGYLVRTHQHVVDLAVRSSPTKINKYVWLQTGSLDPITGLRTWRHIYMPKDLASIVPSFSTAASKWEEKHLVMLNVEYDPQKIYPININAEIPEDVSEGVDSF